VDDGVRAGTQRAALSAESSVIPDLVALGPDDDLWPGNVLDARAAAEGTLSGLPVALGPLTVSSTLRAATTSAHIAVPTVSGYRAALAELLRGQVSPTGMSVASKIVIGNDLQRRGPV